MIAKRTWTCVLLAALLPLAAWAGRTCEETPVTPQAMGKALRLAQYVRDTLDGAQADAAVLGRIGSDLSKYGLRYTHAGLAYRAERDGAWTVLHKLNHCGSEDADLFRQGLANFLLDDPHEYRVLILVPQERVQGRWATAATGEAGLGLHQRRYSLIAHPYGTRYQNSNGWLLELLASADAESPLVSRETAQAHLRRTAYRPSVVRIDPLARLGASLFKANVAFSDHPMSERVAGRYSVVSVESIADYLDRRGLLASRQELALPESFP